MSESTRGVIKLAGLASALLLVYAMLYMVGMKRLEGEERSFLHSLAWASETMTGIGYGRDSVWTHPAMVLVVVSLQWMKLVLLLLGVRLVVLPYMELRFERRSSGAERSRPRCSGGD